MKWSLVPIESIKSSARNALVGGPFGSDLTAKHYTDDGVPVIRGGNLPDNAKFHDDDFVFVSDKKATALSANTAGPGDLVFTQRGTLGQVGLIPQAPQYPRYVVSQSQMKLTVDSAKADAEFVYYFFRLPSTVAAIKNHISSSGVPHINLGVLRHFKIPLPPLDIQKKIVSTASAYDDLMENNRRRMALLEESARLLYREWFVHLRFPGHEHARLINGIPQGWERVPLGEMMTLQRGHDLPSQDRIEGDVPIVSSSGITGFHDKKKADAPGVVTGRYGTLGQVYYIDRDYWPLNTALYVTDFKDSSPLFILHLLKHALESIQSDKAAIPGLNRNVVHSMNVLRPPANLIASFGDFAADVYRQISTLTEQTQKLRTTRDLLLPRLMSGEIEV